MRAFVVIKRPPSDATTSPQVVGVVVQRGGGVLFGFCSREYEAEIWPSLRQVDLTSVQGPGFPVPGLDRNCTCWEIPVRGDESLEQLYMKWVGPIHFF